MKPIIMVLVALLFVLLWVNTAHAEGLFEKPKDWDKGDTDKLLFNTVLIVVDWQQTRQIALNPGKWEETNFILGRNPSVGKVDTYMLASIGVNYLIAKNMPKKWRDKYQLYICLTRSKAIVTNYSIGIRF